MTVVHQQEKHPVSMVYQGTCLKMRDAENIMAEDILPYFTSSLNEDDPYRHTEFCEWYVVRQEADYNFYKTILWGDEVTFKLNGRVKRHNCES